MCLGSSAGGPTALSCDIPLEKLRLAPFSLVQGDAVLALVQAHNEIDWGPISETTEAAGAAIFQAKPHQMAEPTRGSGTSTTAIQVRWTGLIGD